MRQQLECFVKNKDLNYLNDLRTMEKVQFVRVRKKESETEKRREKLIIKTKQNSCTKETKQNRLTQKSILLI